MSEQVGAPPASPGGRRWLATLKQGFTLVFLRDWHPILRVPLDVFRLSFPVGAAFYASFSAFWTRATNLVLDSDLVL